MEATSTTSAFEIPEIQAFQLDGGANGALQRGVNVFRGDVNFYLNLVTLAGRNGLDVHLSALYRSNLAQTATARNLEGPTDVLGLGWQLPIERIVASPSGAATWEGTRCFLVRDASFNPLLRTSRRWRRGRLDASWAGALDTGLVTAELSAAFAASGLAVAAGTPVEVIASGARWAVSDPRQEEALSIERHGDELAVFDGGLAYELQGFQFWRIRYYRAFERWAVTRDDGITTSYGGGLGVDGNGIATSAGDSVEWGVRWDNWVGPSALTHDPDEPTQRVQQQFAVAWNQARAQTAWGDEVGFEYEQVRQVVGAGGLPYTKDCRLGAIRDVFGRTLRCRYAPKSFSAVDPEAPREYADPYKPVPNDVPDAHQSRYGTHYLSTIEVDDEQGEPLFALEFDYSLDHFARWRPGDPPSLYGDTVKRTLRGIRKTFPDGWSAPDIRFDYADAEAANPGALAAVTYPEGGTVRYVYQRKELPGCTRRLKIENPFANATPRVWWGPDYAVVAWYDGKGQIALSVYTWIGRWQLWEPPIPTIPAWIDLDDLHVGIEADFFVLHYAEAGGNGSAAWAFHRDDRVLGAWLAAQQNPIRLQTVERELATGECFFAIADQQASTLLRFTWDRLTRSWVGDVPLGLCASPPPDRRRLFVGASVNVMLVLCYDRDGSPGEKRNRLALHWLDELGGWHVGDTVTASEVAMSDEDSFSWSASPAMVAASFVIEDRQLESRYRLALYTWGARGSSAYKLKPVATFDRSLPKSQPDGKRMLPTRAAITPSGLVGIGPHLLRFNGVQWLVSDRLELKLPATDDTVFWFAYGEDVVVKTENAPNRVIGAVQAFDANLESGAWSAHVITIADKAPVPGRLGRYFPTSAGDLLTWDTSVYSRGSSSDWIEPLRQAIGALDPALDTTTLVDEAPAFLAALRELDDGSVLGTEALILRDGLLGHSERLAERFFRVVKQDGTYETGVDGRVPGGPGSFVTYLPLHVDFDDATSLTLHRALDGSVTEPVQDTPIYSVTLADGYGEIQTTYSFDVDSAACDPSGSVVKYYRARVYSAGSESRPAHGWSEQRFYNGMPERGNPVTEPAVLDGLPRESLAFDADGREVSRTLTRWQVFDAVEELDGQLTPIAGAYVRPSGGVRVQDRVEVRNELSYDRSCGQPVGERTWSYNGDGALEECRVERTYGHRPYPALWWANDLGQLVASRASVQVGTVDPVVTSATATTWQACDRDGETPICVWAAHGAYLWTGGASSSHFDFAAWSGGTRPPQQWLRTSLVLVRSSRGLVCERADPVGIVQSTLYDRLQERTVAVFAHASIAAQEAFYYGFEDYEDPQGWALDPLATPIVEDFSHAGARSLSVPPDTVAAPLWLKPVNRSRSYTFGFWARLAPGFDPTAAAGCRVVVGGDGGSVIDLRVRDTSWSYHWCTVMPGSAGAGAAVQLTAYNEGNAALLIDDVAFASADGQLFANVYEGPQSLLAAEIGPNADAQRRIYDYAQRLLARTDEAGNVVSIVHPWLSRQRQQDTFDPLEPNRETALKPTGATLYERFRDGGDWGANWYSATPEQWTSGDGWLRHAAGAVGQITLTEPPLSGHWCASLTVASPAAPARALGVHVGAALTLEYDPSDRRWSLIDHAAGTRVQARFVSGPGRTWLVSVSPQAIVLCVDGRLLISYLPPAPAAGPPALFAGDAVAFTDVVFGEAPQLGVKLFDGAGRPRQGQSVDGALVTVSATVYDELARPAVVTKPADQQPDTMTPLLAYRPDFVTGLDWASGVMSGAVANAYPADQGYPYRRERYERSPLGRVLQSGAPGRELAITGDPHEHVASFAYGANGPGELGLELPAGEYFVLTRRDQDGAVTKSITEKSGAPVAHGALLDDTSGRWVVTSANTEYTTTGKVLRERLPNDHRPPPRGEPGAWVRTSSYDMLGRCIHTETPDAGALRSVFDLRAALRFSQDAAAAAAGRVVYAKYDVLGRLLEQGTFPYTWDEHELRRRAETQPDWPGQAEQTEWAHRYFYGADGTDPSQLGRLVRADVAVEGQLAASVRYRYDARALLVSQSTSVDRFDAEERRVDYGYDTLGSLIETRYPSGRRIVCRRDAVGRVRSLVDEGGTVLVDYAYAASDQLTRERRYPGTVAELAIEYAYTPAGWLARTSSPILTETLSYTSGGYRGDGYHSGKVAAQAVSLALPAPAELPAEVEHRFRYDALGRLLVAEGLTGGVVRRAWSLGLQQPLSYDDNGNMLSVEAGAQLHSYRYAPGSDFVTAVEPGPTDQYAANAVGDVTRAAPRAIDAIDYDLASRLPTRIASATAGTSSLLYDTAGRRLYKHTPTLARLYLRDPGGTPLLEVERSNDGAVTVSEYVQGATGLIAVRGDTGARAILRDHLGSTRAVLGEDTSVVAAYQYEPFGALIGDPYGDADALRYLFAGTELDAETGLYSAGLRLYDPALRRFYATDPAMQYASPYLYAGNNPATLVDPTGAISWPAILIGAVLAIAGVASIALTAGADAPLVAAVGSILGSTALGAGVGGVSYGATHDHFEGKAFGTALGIGAAGGFVAGATAVGFAAITDAVIAQALARVGSEFLGGGRDILLGAARGLVVGTGSSEASTMTTNALEGRPLENGLLVAFLTGAAVGGPLEALASSKLAFAGALSETRFRADWEEMIAGRQAGMKMRPFNGNEVRNFAVARLQQGGFFYRTQRFTAFSGGKPQYAQNGHPDLSPVLAPGNGVFRTTGAWGHVHSEAKIFEGMNATLAGQVDKRGRLLLVSLRDYCDSCRGVADQFKRQYRDIKFRTNYFWNYQHADEHLMDD